ncbi:MAG: methane monooxygenase/ammonia monooxygenase subunit C, partial [Nitrosospira sp.]
MSATTPGKLATQQAEASRDSYDMSEWYDSRYYKIGLLPVLGIAIFWVWFQRTYAYSHGMDSMEPEFEQIWMGLWRFQMMLWPVVAVVVWGWLWMTRNTAEKLANL